MAGRGQALYAGLRGQLPIFRELDVTLCESYALPDYYRPPALLRKHVATHRSWLTAAPSWFLIAVAEGLLGAR